MFETEANSLNAIKLSRSIKVPTPQCAGQTQNHSFLLLEYLTLGRSQGDSTALGISLAAMHQHQAEYFGWKENNFIGHTEQPNQPGSDWIGFWNNQRISYQAKLANKNRCPGKTLDLLEELMQNTSLFFNAYTPLACLLHGDLWGGNAGFLNDGTPVIFDPASYYGDRETDLAMTELFGGFDRAFYTGYNSVWPMDPGYGVRKYLYQLYHVLNHFNLFGGHYATQAHRICEKLLSEI